MYGGGCFQFGECVSCVIRFARWGRGHRLLNRYPVPPQDEQKCRREGEEGQQPVMFHSARTFSASWT